MLDTSGCPSMLYLYMEMLTKMPDKYGVIHMAGGDSSYHGALSYVFERELC
jgi:hypothetical protein